MALLSWSKQYLIGDDLIDAEHEELFRLINDFHSRWSAAHNVRATSAEHSAPLL